MAGLLVIGFICNLLIKPVDPKYYMTDAELEAERRRAHERAAAIAVGTAAADGAPSGPALVAGAWLLVGIPSLWGVWVTLQKAATLF
jgi:hypothetical protein